MMAVLQTIDLKKYYGEGENQVKALDGICLEIEEGKFTAIVGTSGSGKGHIYGSRWRRNIYYYDWFGRLF